MIFWEKVKICCNRVIKAAFEKRLWFLAGMVCFNFIPGALIRAELGQYMGIILYGLFLLMIMTFFTIVLELIPSNIIKKFLFITIFILNAVVLLLEIFTVYKYKALIGAGIITAVLDTNLHETKEFFKMYVGMKWILAMAVYDMCIYWVYKYRARISMRLSGLSYMLIILILTISGGLSWNYLRESHQYKTQPPFTQTAMAAGIAVKNIRNADAIENRAAEPVEILQNDSTIPNIVFIIGESTNRDHMHLYGYPLPDTPRFDELKKKHEIAVFENCVSPHATTVAVLQELLTFGDYESTKPWYEYNSIIDVMKAAGYRTYWLSNQESSGIYGNIGLHFAKESDFSKFTRTRDSSENMSIYDQELFPLIDNAIKNHAEKNFYAIHLIGEHAGYSDRYPNDFNKFSKDDIKGDLSDYKKSILAQYANAVYYNDYIVNNIIDKFRDLNAIVIYVPDHGETIFDNGSDFNGHVEENINHYMLEIPVIMWASASFRQQYPKKWLAIQKSVNEPYMTDDMIHTVLDIADIKTNEYDSSRSIINSNFNKDRRRMVDGRDYDTEISGK
ncbi:phosphoethanolamine transferase [Pectinatus frisingensis]|uniref:phosphoethanolamine transferase n=1 Tax=Pectinatus frisingensis TaxID=865 RepID=UPI0018C7C2FF|nr:phosphoethanolamine transferase [Pectinatus frisingensis]